MAAIIQLRRGSSPSSLSYGEPYINDDSASLVVGLSGSNDIITLAKLEQKNFGNLWIDGDLTASNISASGDIRIGGQLFLGDAAEDAVVIQGSLSSSLIPESGSTYNIGSSTKPWNNLHIGQIFATTTVVTSSAQITAFGFISSSTDISSINNFTQSADQRLDSLESDSGSYLTSSGSVSYDDITSKPTLLSGSAQITAFGFTSSSTDISSLNTFTSSADQRLDSLEGDSGSYLTSLDGGIVSSSAQITAFGFTSSSADISSLNSFTQSFNTAITLSSDDVTILGNLTVQGTETTLNTQTLQVEDKNILVASGAADSAAANGAGLTIDGANKSLQWNHTDSQFRFDADVSASAFYGDGSNLTNVGAPLTSLNAFTASNGNDSLNAFTSSNSNDSLNAATSSYLTSSGSVDYSDITSVPSGIVSSSAQITAFGFVSSSGGNLTSLNAFTQSADQRLDSLESDSGSYLTSSGSVDFTDITSVPSGLLSSSAQITSFGFISESSENTSLNAYTASNDINISNIHSITSSFDQRLDSLEGESGSYLTSSGSVDYSDITSLPTLVSQSDQVNYNDLLNKPAFIGGVNVTITSASNGITINATSGSGGASVAHLNSFTQSANVRFGQLSTETGSQNQRLDSLESESGSYLTTLDSGIVSTSAQITTFGFISESTSLTSLNSYTASNDINITNIHSTTSSLEQRVGQIELNTGSYGGGGTDLTQLNTFTGSANQRLDSLESESGSYVLTSGTQTIGGNKTFSGLTTIEGDLTLNENIVHNGDNNTRFSFGTDSITLRAGTYSFFNISATEIVANSQGNDIDFRVRGDNDNYTLYVDAGNDRVHIGESTGGTQKLNIKGAVSASSYYGDGSNLTNVGADLTSLNSFTASNGNDSLNSITSSFDQRLDSLEGESGSYNTITAFHTFTASLGTVSTFAVTQSVQDDDTLIPTARAVSASIAEVDTANLTSLNSFTASNGNDSLNTFTGSNGNTSINSFTSSFNTALTLDSSNVTVLGNLTVQGTETILNTQTLNIEDKNLLIASGAADSSAANGGGITIDGANATMTWNHSDSRLDFNKSLHITGDIEATGDVVAFASSDERLKDNIQPIENPLEKLSQISGKTFDWNEEKQNIYKGRDYGVIAQEIEAVLPELVNTREDTGYKAVKYDKLVPLLIESIKELQKQIEELKSK